MMSTVKYPVPKAALMHNKPTVHPAAPTKKVEEAPIFLQSELFPHVMLLPDSYLGQGPDRDRSVN